MVSANHALSLDKKLIIAKPNPQKRSEFVKVNDKFALTVCCHHFYLAIYYHKHMHTKPSFVEKQLVQI